MLALATICAHPTSAQTNRIAAIVNEDMISEADLRARIDLILLSSNIPNTPEIRERLAPQVLRTLIDDRLRLQEIRRQKIQVTEQEVDDALKHIAENNKMTVDALYRLLDGRQIDRSVLRIQIEADLGWRKLVANQVRATANVSEEAVDDAIRRIDANKGKPEYLVSEIFISMQAGRSAAETRQIAERMRQQIAQGANFAELARSFSQSASAANGGSLGWIREDQLDPALLEAITAMKPGEISPPIQGVDGFYILALRNRRISQGLVAGDATLTIQQVFVPLAGAKPEEKVAVAQSVTASAKSCADMEAAGKRVGSPQSGRISNVKLSSLPPVIRDAVTQLADNQPSRPIALSGGIMVLMVCERVEESAEAEIRSRVRLMLTNERGEMLSRRLMRNLYRSAFLDIRK